MLDFLWRRRPVERPAREPLNEAPERQAAQPATSRQAPAAPRATPMPAIAMPASAVTPADLSVPTTFAGFAVRSVSDSTFRCVGRDPIGTEQLAEVLLYRPRGHALLGMLLINAPEARPICVLSDPLVAPVLSYVLDPSFLPGRHALRAPTAPRFICAVPPNVSPDADLNCNRDAPGGWETLTLEPRAPAELFAPTKRLVAAIEAFFANPMTAGNFLAWMDTQPADLVRSCGQAILRLLDRDALQTIARRCLDEEGFLERLVPDGSTDRWWRDMLPSLRRWNVDRESPAKLFLDQRFDYLGWDFGWKRFASLGEILDALARETIEPRRGICVMTTARNEGIYFLEWIAHHRALGVEHFIVYSNDNDDGSDVLLERLSELGYVTWVSNKVSRGVDLQTRAYAHCLTYLRKPLDFRWTILIDLDEFITLNPDRYGNLHDLLDLQASRGAEAVSMNWVMYTPGRHARWDPRPMMERFHYRERNDNPTVKTAFLSRLHVASWPHNPVGSFRRFPIYLNAAGRLHHGPGTAHDAHSGEPVFEDAWIAHYFFKSLDEYIWKTSRGFDLRKELSFNVAVMFGFLAWFDPSSSNEDTRALHHLPALKSELARLRSMPRLAEAEALAREAFQRRVEAMKVEIRRAVEAYGDLDGEAKSAIIGLLDAPVIEAATAAEFS